MPGPLFITFPLCILRPLAEFARGLGNMIAAPDRHGDGEQIKKVCNTLGQMRRTDEGRAPALCAQR